MTLPTCATAIGGAEAPIALRWRSPCCDIVNKNLFPEQYTIHSNSIHEHILYGTSTSWLMCKWRLKSVLLFSFACAKIVRKGRFRTLKMLTDKKGKHASRNISPSGHILAPPNLISFRGPRLHDEVLEWCLHVCRHCITLGGSPKISFCYRVISLPNPIDVVYLKIDLYLIVFYIAK